MRTGLVDESGERESLGEMLKKITGMEEQKKERGKKKEYYFNERDNKIYYLI